MRIAEVNRLFRWFEESGPQKDVAAACLAYVLDAAAASTSEASVFEKNMTRHFPDPFSRAAVLKRLVLASADEEEDDGHQIAAEQPVFLSQFLEACADLFEQSADFESARARFRNLADFTLQDMKTDGV